MFGGNNSAIVQRALERRPCWQSALPPSARVPVAEDDDDEAAATPREAAQSATDSTVRARLQRRRRMQLQKAHSALVRLFDKQEFNLVWKPVTGVKPGEDGGFVTLHT